MPKQTYKIHRSLYAAYLRRYRRQALLALSALLIFSLGTVALAYSFYQSTFSTGRSSIGPAYTQQIAGPQLFRSSYFQFSDTSNWVYAANDSGVNKVTYLLYEGGLPVHSLTVYVNQPPTQDGLAVNHVLPVQIEHDTSFSVGNLSPACDAQDADAASEPIHSMTLSGVKMICRPDSPQFSAVVGQIGGDYNLSLKRSSGQIANYVIVYHNLSVNPDPSAFVRIMQSFQAL